MITTSIEKATEQLKGDQLVAIPTETVYGLAANAFSETAIKKIFALKKRPLNNPLIVHIKASEDLDLIATDIPLAARKLAERFWPGPLTLVLKKRASISHLITAGNDTVAVRMPNHKVTLDLLHSLDFPIVAPSANPFKSISPTTAQHVETYFEKEKLTVLDGGACTFGIESTIIGFEGNRPLVYRLGSIPLEKIKEVIGDLESSLDNNEKPNAPGMMNKHYAPQKRMVITTNLSEEIAQNKHLKIGILAYSQPIFDENVIYQEVLSNVGCTEEAASNLYASLHRIDKSACDIIIAERLPEYQFGLSVNDRLKRAASA